MSLNGAYHLIRDEYHYEFHCNICNNQIYPIRVFCKDCEVGTVDQWQYESFDLCVDCASGKKFDHAHPRSSLSLERIAIVDQLDHQDTEVGAEAVHFEKCPFCRRELDCRHSFHQKRFVAATKKKEIFGAHIECLGWLPEAFYFQNHWYNVAAAHKRALKLRCCVCKQVGAAVGCFEKRCNRSFHIPCYEATVGKASGKILWCSMHLHKRPATTQSPKSDDISYSMGVHCSYFDIPGKAPRWSAHCATDFSGTWIPQLVNWAINRYSSESSLVVSNFLGRGTDAIEAFLLNRKFIGFDINSEYLLQSLQNLSSAGWCDSGDAKLTLLQRDAKSLLTVSDGSVDLLLSHPPYYNCIVYSDLPNDLSSCASFSAFLSGMHQVASESNRILAADGVCILMIGDNRSERFIVPVAFSLQLIYLEHGFFFDEVRSCSSTGNAVALSTQFDFVYLMHEFFCVLGKNPQKSGQQQEIFSASAIEPCGQGLNMHRHYYQPSTLFGVAKRKHSGSIWTLDPYSTGNLYQRAFERLATWSSSVLIYSDYLTAGEIEYSCSYKQTCPTNAQDQDLSPRDQCMQRNRNFFESLVTQSKSALAENSTSVVSLVLCDLGWGSQNFLKSFSRLKFVLDVALDQLPVDGHFVVRVYDTRLEDGTMQLNALAVWSLIEKVCSNCQRSLLYKDIVIAVPTGYEKTPGKQFQPVPGPLDIVHEYLFIYQLKIKP